MTLLNYEPFPTTISVSQKINTINTPDITWFLADRYLNLLQKNVLCFSNLWKPHHQLTCITTLKGNRTSIKNKWRKNTKICNFGCLRHPRSSSRDNSFLAFFTFSFWLAWKIISACLTQLNASLTVGSTRQKSKCPFCRHHYCITLQAMERESTHHPSKIHHLSLHDYRW